MSDPGDKSDDLISELARLMASSAGGSDSAVKPMAKPVPLNSSASGSATPVRIPGMDAPLPVSTVPQMAPILTQSPPPPPANEPPRAAVTGTIRIPGMDQPAPVTTSAPVAKFDFGKPPTVAPIRSDSGPVFTPRGASVTSNAAPAGTMPASPTRIPSQLQPVSENRSFGQGPSPVVVKPAVTEPAAKSPFDFDFGLGQSSQQPKPANDPIADLIAAELNGESQADAVVTPMRPVEASATPVVRAAATPQQAPAKPAMAPMGGSPVPLKAANTAPRAVENDRFAISPGIGFNGRPAANQPLNTPVIREPEPEAYADESDPMAEIESLIGEAVRVELGPGPVKVQTAMESRSEHAIDDDVEPSPVVPPLNAQFVPRRTSPVEHDEQGEDAILAAQRDSGADIGRLDGPMGEESPYRRLKVKPQRQSGSGGLRQYIGMAVAGTLLLAAGLGLYWVLNMGRGTDANAPVLTADATPTKVAPTPEVTPSAETPTSPVMQQLDGASTAPSTEQLVTTDQTSGEDPLRVVGDSPTPAATATAADDPAADSGLANRKVRTVTVRPDGTIVPGDDSVAGAAELPVDRPNVPEVPGADDSGTALLDNPTSIAAAGDPIASAIAAPDATPLALVPDAGASTANGDLVGEISAAGGFLDNTKVAPKPAHQPNYAALAAAPVQTATRPLAAVQQDTGPVALVDAQSQPATTPVASSGAAAYVQLTSSPSEQDANAQLRSQTTRFGSLFEGKSLMVQAADLGQRGTWYRVRLPVGSLSDATRICANIKASGGDCIATGG